MPMSKYLSNEINDHVLRNESWTAPTSVWIALFTAVTGLDDNTPSAEVSGGSYVRLEVGGSSGRNFTASSNKASTNAQEWDFATPTAGWGTITHAAVMSASSSGNVLYWGQLSVSKVVNTGEQPGFLAGDFDILFS